MARFSSKLFLITISLAFIGGCAVLSQLGGMVQKPEVSYRNMSFESMSFDGIGLKFNFDLENPNNVNLKASGYNYALSIDDQKFIEGQNNDGLELKSLSTSQISIPVQLNFRELYSTVSSVVNSDSVAYGISSAFSFDIPVLGLIEIPVSANGHLPVPKLPALSFESMSLGSISLTGAEVRLNMLFENPNSFGLSFSDIKYKFMVDGSEWASTGINNVIDLSAKGSQRVEIPIRLDFATLGLSAYRLLTGGSTFNYRLVGDGNVKVDLPYFDQNNRLPFDLAGSYRF